MAKKITGISIPKELLEELDKKRGLIKRSTYITEIIKKALASEGQNE